MVRMKPLGEKTILIIYLISSVIFLCGLWFLPALDRSSTILAAAFRVGFSFFVLFLTFSISLGLGSWLIDLLGIDFLGVLGNIVFALILGLGAISFVVMILGFLGLLKYWLFVILLLSSLYFSLSSLSDLINRVPFRRWNPVSIWRTTSWFERSVGLIVLILFLLSLFQALTPPWSPDGLTYHLEGPVQFLEEDRILLLPDIWGGNGPFLAEMLFMMSLNFGLESIPKLIHLTYGVCLSLLTYLFGQRFFSPNIGWLGSLILIGIPIFPIWSTLAYVDMAWAVYEFGALYALLVWVENKKNVWLVLSGILIGFGMGTKYLAMGGGVILGLFVIWFAQKASLREICKTVGIFVGMIFLIASPWYLKNWVLGGNPVYPLYFGGKEWPMERVSWLMAYLKSFGVGKTAIDYIRLPWDLYARHTDFSTFLGSIEIPSILYPVLVLAPFIRRTKMINSLIIFSFLRFGFWAVGSQQVRFLLPMLPGLSLLTAYTIDSVKTNLSSKQMYRILVHGLIGGVLVSSCLYSLIYFYDVKPAPVVFGIESTETFLRRRVNNYRAQEYIRQELPAESRVLMLWDGEGYYCDNRCWPDTEHTRWTRHVHSHQNVSETTDWLLSNEVTHLLLTEEYASFVISIDDGVQHREAYLYLKENYAPACLEKVYEDNHTTLWSVECSNDKAYRPELQTKDKGLQQ